MIKAGFESTDPRTDTRTVVVEGPGERAGRGWVLEVHCPEGAPPSIPEHLHVTWTETFEVLQGAAAYRLGGEDHPLFAGESVVLPAGVPHIHPWNAGVGEMVYRQTDDFGGIDRTALDDVIGTFATIHALASEGKVNRKGLPKNPLQSAASLRTLTRHGGYDAALPIALQKLVAATLGRLAEALGYRAVDRRFVP